MLTGLRRFRGSPFGNRRAVGTVDGARWPMVNPTRARFKATQQNLGLGGYLRQATSIKGQRQC